VWQPFVKQLCKSLQNADLGTSWLSLETARTAEVRKNASVTFALKQRSFSFRHRSLLWQQIAEFQYVLYLHDFRNQHLLAALHGDNLFAYSMSPAAGTGQFGGGIRYRFAMNPLFHWTILRKSITLAYVHLRGNKSKLGLEKLESTFNTAPLQNQQAMWHITIWRSHWRRRRYIQDSR